MGFSLTSSLGPVSAASIWLLRILFAPLRFQSRSLALFSSTVRTPPPRQFFPLFPASAACAVPSLYDLFIAPDMFPDPFFGAHCSLISADPFPGSVGGKPNIEAVGTGPPAQIGILEIDGSQDGRPDDCESDLPVTHAPKDASLRCPPTRRRQDHRLRRLVDAGLYPTGILDEHRATRTAVGVFDVCHMGEVHFRGRGAAATVQRLVTNDVARLENGRAFYTVACLTLGRHRRRSDRLSRQPTTTWSS